ncbi:MAG TPA: acyl-CoA dehydrogenase family protein [Paracoccaceae bacterium]|nr:acyl-CoA dehydrogenase family protein [Paracoccaceae bacterium]
MQSLLTSEQALFAEAVERFVAREYGTGPGRPHHVFDRARLGRLAELGCLALAIPPELGGIGGAVEAMIALERLAPALPPEPVVASAIHAASALALAAPGALAADLLPQVAEGELVLALAHFEEPARYRLACVEARAEPAGSGFRLFGRKPLVAAATQADLFIVSAREAASGRLSLFLVDPRRPGLTVLPRGRLDNMPAGDVHLDGCELGAEDRLDAMPAEAALEAASDRAEAAQIAEMVGLMDALTRTTIDYVRTRRQFGTPIGSFQALQHRIADMWIAAEEARSLAFAAALAVEGPEAERARAVSMAKVRAIDAARLVGAEAIQLHGGIGMTDELIVSHWYKRLWALCASLGDRRHHLARLAAAA